MLSVILINETCVKRRYNIKKLKINTRYFGHLISTKLLILIFILIFFLIFFLLLVRYLLVFSLFLFFLLLALNSERFAKNNLDRRINDIVKILERYKNERRKRVKNKKYKRI